VTRGASNVGPLADIDNRDVPEPFRSDATLLVRPG
jgi:hypothetical protein